MFLSDRDIRDEIEKGNIKIEKGEVANIHPASNIQPASIDLRLGDNFLMLDYHKGKGIIRFDEEPDYEKKTGTIILPSLEFVLGTTLEYISISPNLVANVQGRSSIGRRGLFVQNAGWIDPGFEGNITLELFNGNRLPIELKPGIRICQLIFGYTKTPSENPYHGKYLGQRGTTGSRSYQDREYS
ncbi:dCTP deaminase, dUMP-forming [uncultured archaeon]|nr:dCTP deaminase, dUMP-forming [uncultured archaeon]